MQHQTFQYFSAMASPLGKIYLLSNEAAITAIVFENSWTRFKKSCGELVEKDTAIIKSAKKQLKEYFAGKRQDFDLSLQLEGTEFEQKAWKALTKIPFGRTKSYGEQARAIGKPLASRAVGRANGRNPIPIVVPCHRVIGASGKLTGYSSGLGIKKALLDLEALNAGSQI